MKNNKKRKYFFAVMYLLATILFMAVSFESYMFSNGQSLIFNNEKK